MSDFKRPDYTPIHPKYRILSVKAVGDTGTKVRVTYYDTNDFRFHEKFDDWKHITVSREIVPKKHNYTPETILAALKEKYPTHEFSTKPYGSGDSTNIEIYGDREVYTQGTKSFIVWHHGGREERNTLEFFLDEDKKKQIFFRNSPKRFLARTRLIDNSRIDSCKKHFTGIEGLESLLAEDITVKHTKQGDKAYVQVRCLEKQLYLLPEAYFRVLVYNSESFSTENKAQELYEEIRFMEGSRTYIDQLKIVESIDEGRHKIFYVKATCDANKSFNENKSFTQKLMDIGMHPKIKVNDDGKSIHVRSARQELWDPLLLNNFAQQLRDFFPIHMSYNPDIPLINQANTLIHPFVDKAVDLGRHQNYLGFAISDAMNFYLRNTCAIDLEVIDFSVGKQDISGRVYMAVLNSLNENKLYMTKEAWHNEEFKNSLLEKYGDKAKLIFAEDELDIIAKLSADSARYYNIIGHNFRDFDHEHLTKYNYEHKLFKKGDIDLETKKRIRELCKGLNMERLWSHTSEQVLDTYQYVKHRVDLFADHKLSTFAGFKKSLTYEQMHDMIKSGKLDELGRIVEYTLEDGDKSWILNKQLLENGILESLATNKSLSSIFSSDPVKNFYDSGKRTYFMRLNTFRDRHSMSPRRHLKKFDNRMYNQEILLELVKEIPQKFGQIRGELYYPSLFIESFMDIIDVNPATKYIYIKMKNEMNALVKADLLWKLSAALVVPVDKMKNYIEASGNKFGDYVEPSQVYKSLSAEPGDVWNTYYGTNDFELSRTSFIFRIEYSARGSSIKADDLPLDTTMIDYNNRFAYNLERFKKTDFFGRSKKYFISDGPLGYSLGEVRAINLDNERFIGRLSDDKDLYQSIRKPKNPLIYGFVQDWLNDTPIDRDVAIRDVLRLPYDEQINDTNRQIIKALLGFDPLLSKGNLQLLF
ncbi:MAG: hypothetical protein ACP5OA_06870 [Candidatus Woesearchaeota archaeon]